MLPKPFFSVLFLFLLPLLFQAQSDSKQFVFPESIPGYLVLKCDFHMHTVFSDGLVWPTTRVDEAVNEGLDAIAISEHLEYWSNKNYIKGDHNSSYEIAKPYADKKDLILIRGCEITKSMPPGHFNFLFIKDANAIDSVDWKKAIIQAREQGAFIMWNHPGWRMENTIPVWFDEHSWLLSEGLLDGIEVVNENEYYPKAWQWCIDSNLCIFGNSDAHDPVDLFWDKGKDEHRPITLVFAKDRTEEGIRDALDSGRTAVFYKDQLLGDEEYLMELFYKSFEVVGVRSSPADGPQRTTTYIKNNSSISFVLEIQDDNDETIVLNVPAYDAVPFELDEAYLESAWTVKNFLVAPGKALKVNYIN